MEEIPLFFYYQHVDNFIKSSMLTSSDGFYNVKTTPQKSG